jgi:hypothetical protein
VTAGGLAEGEYEMLTGNGWHLVDGPAISLDPSTYRDYIVSSAASSPLRAISTCG